MNNNEAKYTKGLGSINLIIEEPNNFPPKKSYKDIYPYTVIITGIIDP